MGEYSREQSNQLSRVLPNNLSAKTNRFIDNRFKHTSQLCLANSIQKTEEQKQNKEINSPINKPIGYNLKTILQAKPWANEPAKFKTENGMERIGVPNSEYIVTASGYTRYAPINTYRAPGQVFLQEDPHSFAYLTPTTNKKIASSAIKATCSGDIITLISSSARTFLTRIPQNGLNVWDANVDVNDNISWIHLGHPVIELGEYLPTLEDGKKNKEEKIKQTEIKVGQKNGTILSDKEVWTEYRNLVDLVYSEMFRTELEHTPSQAEQKALYNVAKKKAYIEIRRNKDFLIRATALK